MEPAAGAVGRRVLVIGIAGSGKSTFSRVLSERTGLPVIHLDVHYWQPGWVEPSEDAWRATQRGLLGGDAWIADGNDLETLDLRLERADTVVLLDTPWWTCAYRAFVRGLRKPVGEMPEGCRDSFWRRLHDEWRLVGVILRDRGSEPERGLAIVAEQGQHAALHVLGSRRAAQEFLGDLGGSRSTGRSSGLVERNRTDPQRPEVVTRPTPVRRETPMGEDNGEKKTGFFGKLFRLAFIGAVVAAVVSFIKRRRGADFDDSEWQELPPPAGG